MPDAHEKSHALCEGRGRNCGAVQDECIARAQRNTLRARVNGGRSRGLVLGFGLQAVEIIHGLLGMRCGAEDRALVVLQYG